MKVRAIKKVLSRKFNEFTDSIPDEKVKEAVTQHGIIAGGAIASLLLGQKVNDYDIYFDNLEAAKRVGQYYINLFNDKSEYGVTLEEEEGRIKIKVAGGAAGEEIAEEDDLPLRSLLELGGLGVNLDEEAEAYVPRFITENAISLIGDIQLIMLFQDQPLELIQRFDFVHCRCYWIPGGELVLPPESILSILTQDLKYVGNDYPLHSLIRVRKYLRRGWFISAGELLKIAVKLNELDLMDVETLQNQLMGVDVAYFREMWSMIDDLNGQLTPPALYDIIDSVF